MRPLIPVVLLCALVTPTVPVMAETPFPSTICHKTENMSQRLTRQHGAERSARGTQGPDQILEVWTNDRGGWTLVVTYATGLSCIVAMGKDWESLLDNPAG